MPVPSVQTYSRLFAGGRHEAFDEGPLKALAEAMATPVPLNSDKPSGIVYFGQLIDHDLTRDETRLQDAGEKAPEQTINFRSAKFDLDSIYGKGPAGELADSSIAPEDYRYNHAQPGCERFRLGRVDPPASGKTVSMPLLRSDLPRRTDLTAVIADDRNDENSIIAQLTVIFLKFHNRMLDLLEQDEPLIQHVGGDSLFEKARRLVTWHYQYLVIHEFAQSILLGTVFRSVLCQEYVPRLFCPKPGEPINLPVEFSMAAFRFGHSMVRSSYNLNSGALIPLANLLRREPRRLTADEIIDWDLFFGSRGSGTNLAQRVDTRISEALAALPPNVVTLFTGCVPSEILSLPARTLIRGSRVGLPSGQEAHRQAVVLSGQDIPLVEFNVKDPHYELVKQYGFDQRTPLWFYLLHEAWILGSDFAATSDRRQSGLCLGPLGSLIVAEVIRGILSADRDSFFSAQPIWTPPVPELIYLPSGEKAPITSMDRLIRFSLVAEH